MELRTRAEYLLDGVAAGQRTEFVGTALAAPELSGRVHRWGPELGQDAIDQGVFRSPWLMTRMRSLGRVGWLIRTGRPGACRSHRGCARCRLYRAAGGG